MMDKEENSLTSNIDDLIREFESSDNPKERKLAEQAKKIHLTHKQFEKSLSNLQESLDYLRICIKYQVFDLEATRRENADLRSLLKGEFDDEEYIG